MPTVFVRKSTRSVNGSENVNKRPNCALKHARFGLFFHAKTITPKLSFGFSPLFWKLYTELHNRVHAILQLQRVEFSFFFNERPRLIVVNNNHRQGHIQGRRR